MSTIIGKTSDKSWLRHWAASLGRKIMQQWGWSLKKELPDLTETRLIEISGIILKQHISSEAMDHGTAVHEMLEDTLNNKSAKKYGVIPSFHYNQIKPLLSNITQVYATELQVYSESLGAAGTADAIVDWQGTPTNIDWKTTKEKKKESDQQIQDYILQAVGYALMINELTDISVEQVAIIQSGLDGTLSIFIKQVKDYEEKLKERIKKYYSSTILSTTNMNA